MRLLSGSRLTPLKRVLSTAPLRNRAFPPVLPHKNLGDTEGALKPSSLRGGTVLPTLPPPVLQGAAVSGEHISQGPPGNVVASGCPPPLRRVLEQSGWSFPAGAPLQGDEPTTQQQEKNTVPSLFGALRGPFCQPCRLWCYRAQRSPASTYLKVHPET
ncbi:hypothetical protein PO909_010503 [Leuciscus waleckii]